MHDTVALPSPRPLKADRNGRVGTPVTGLELETITRGARPITKFCLEKSKADPARLKKVGALKPLTSSRDQRDAGASHLVKTAAR